jgi:hypothetical protein
MVRGNLETMLRKTKARLDGGETEQILIFEDGTGQQVDFDFRGTPDDVLARVEPPAAASGRGRPKLGVVSREISLLPRHWEWLEQQPNGISAAVRRLVDEARKREPGKERSRRARDAASRVMWVMAGNLPDFEEASRALFAGDRAQLQRLMRKWPKDIRAHLEQLVDECDRLAAEVTA